MSSSTTYKNVFQHKLYAHNFDQIRSHINDFKLTHLWRRKSIILRTVYRGECVWKGISSNMY